MDTGDETERPGDSTPQQEEDRRYEEGRRGIVSSAETLLSGFQATLGAGMAAPEGIPQARARNELELASRLRDLMEADKARGQKAKLSNEDLMEGVTACYRLTFYGARSKDIKLESWAGSRSFIGARVTDDTLSNIKALIQHIEGEGRSLPEIRYGSLPEPMSRSLPATRYQRPSLEENLDLARGSFTTFRANNEKRGRRAGPGDPTDMRPLELARRLTHELKVDKDLASRNSLKADAALRATSAILNVVWDHAESLGVASTLAQHPDGAMERVFTGKMVTLPLLNKVDSLITQLEKLKLEHTRHPENARLTDPPSRQSPPGVELSPSPQAAGTALSNEDLYTASPMQRPAAILPEDVSALSLSDPRGSTPQVAQHRLDTGIESRREKRAREESHSPPAEVKKRTHTQGH